MFSVCQNANFSVHRGLREKDQHTKPVEKHTKPVEKHTKPVEEHTKTPISPSVIPLMLSKFHGAIAHDGRTAESVVLSPLILFGYTLFLR